MAITATAPMSFEDKYKEQIGKLATYNKVDAGVGKDMLLSNLTKGGQYKGGGELDYTAAGKDANDYLSKLQQASFNGANANSYSSSGGSTAPRAPDYSGQINSIYDNQKAAQLAQLKASQDKAIGQTNLEQQQALPQYQNMRNQTDVDKAQALQRIREGMANAGLFNSGDNVTGQISLENTRQNAINATDLQQQQYLNSLNQRRADILNPANEQSMLASLNAEQAKALLEGGYRSEDNTFRNNQAASQKAFQEAGLTGMYNGQQTLAAQGQAFNNGIQAGQLTGMYNGAPTLSKQQLDQAGKQFADKMGLDWATLNQHAQESLAQLAVSQQNANTNSSQASLSQQRFNADQGQYSQSQASKQATSSAIAQALTYPDADSAYKALQQFGPQMQASGVDLNSVLNAINQRFGHVPQQTPVQ